jgi:hypothetical protein
VSALHFPIRPKTLEFEMSMVLCENHFERLRQCKHRGRLKAMCAPVVDIDVSHLLPARRILLERPE